MEILDKWSSDEYDGEYPEDGVSEDDSLGLGHEMRDAELAVQLFVEGVVDACRHWL